MGNRITVASLAATAALVAGCSVNLNPITWWSGPEEQPPAQLAGATLYACDGNKRFAVRYDTAGKSAMVILSEREFRLDPAPVAAGQAAGTRYTNGRTTLNVRGDEASLEEGSAMLYANCKRMPAGA